MNESDKPSGNLDSILKALAQLRNELIKVDSSILPHASAKSREQFVGDAAALRQELQRVRELVSPVKFGNIGITLGRSDSIAKFFAFSFLTHERCSLAELGKNPFYGSGVYAIYYEGHSDGASKAYNPLSGSETPIYVGKADPKTAYAETVEEQGQALHTRLKEHAKTIGQTKLDLGYFTCRSAAIQSGMQAAVEEFMIRLFQPIWNKEMKICFGFGKHGDSATTRTNKRSPWDTMHPGRKWAADTLVDQMPLTDIEAAIAAHFEKVPIIPDKEKLFEILSL